MCPGRGHRKSGLPDLRDFFDASRGLPDLRHFIDARVLPDLLMRKSGEPELRRYAIVGFASPRQPNVLIQLATARPISSGESS